MHFRPPEEQGSHKVTCGVRADALQPALDVLEANLASKGVRANVVTSGNGQWRCAPGAGGRGGWVQDRRDGRRRTRAARESAGREEASQPQGKRLGAPARSSEERWVDRLFGRPTRCLWGACCSACVVWCACRYVDIVPVRAGKQAAVNYVRRRFGFLPQETVACGDSGNDILMLQVGGKSVASGAAGDAPAEPSCAACVSQQRAGP